MGDDDSLPRHDSSPPVTAGELLALARRHGLELTAERDAPETSGAEFIVVYARDRNGVRWIVRVPRGPEMVASTSTEARVLELVRPRLPVLVPDWHVHAPDVIAYPRLPGVLASTIAPDGSRQLFLDPAALPPVFLDSYAQMLVALQAIPPDAARREGVPVTTVAATRASLARAMTATRAALRPSDVVWARWQRWLADDSLWPEHVALVHGDLHLGHMLLADDGRLIGVLDWTEARVDDPGVDLAIFLGCFGRDALEQLIERFAAAGGRTWPRIVDHASERWAAYSVMAAAWALQVGSADALEYAREQLAAIDAAWAE
jgi:aminoglycoside phosphotransferase (APT) family kinase protein